MLSTNCASPIGADLRESAKLTSRHSIVVDNHEVSWTIYVLQKLP